MYNPWDYIEPDPDPEDSRYMVYDESREEYVTVWDVSRWKRWRRFIEFDWTRKVVGPLYRLGHNIRRPFMRCIFCGKRGCGPYWFSNTCSSECSNAQYNLRVVNHKKFHICVEGPLPLNEIRLTLCREWIWQEIHTQAWLPDQGAAYDEQFCSFCLDKANQKHRLWLW